MDGTDPNVAGHAPGASVPKALLRTGAGGLLVFLAAYGSIAFTRNAEHLSTFWFANALLLALLLRRPAGAWSVFLCGGFIGQAAAQLLAGDPLPAVLGVSALNMIEVLAVAAALRRWAGRDLDVTRLPHLGLFVLFAGVLAPAAESTVAAVFLAPVKHVSPAALWAVWYPVNALGFLVFTPPLLMWGQASLTGLLRRGRRLETAAWCAALITASAGAFCQVRYPLLFLPMAVLALVAVRLGPAGATLGVGFVAMSAAIATLNGYGPVMLASGDPTTRSFVLQGFVASLVLSNLPLTALLSSLARLDAKAREANRRLRFAETIARMGHWRLDLSSNEVTWSDGVYTIHGCDPASFTPTLEGALALYHPDDRAAIMATVGEAIRTGQGYEAGLRVVRRDGTMRDVLSRGLCETAPDGRVTALFGTVMDVTDLRQAERAMAESQARYRMLADNSSDMITHMDLTGRRLFVSPGARELTGYAAEELVGTQHAAFVHPDDEPALHRKLAELVAGRTDLVTNINRIRHKDGWWIWIEASVKLLRDADGNPSGLVSALRDVTDRKLADEALRQSEKRYKLLAENSTDLIALKPSFRADRSYVSPSVGAMTGYTPDEFLVLPAASYIHPEDEDRIAAVFAALTVGRPAVTALHRIRHKAGHWLWVETDFRLIDTDGPEGTVLLRSRDVTVRHKAEEALAASEARYRALAETTSDVITQLGLDLRRNYVSPSCRTMLGYEPEELVGMRPSTRMHPEDTPAVVAIARRLAAGELDGDRTTVTYRSLHKSGHWIWLETVMSLVRDETTGAPSSLICSLRDITERQRVARHLEQAKEAAESAAVAKTEFVANMSHELRTPLAGIIGVNDLLRMDPGLTDAQRRLVDLAGDAGRSLLAIVNDVLDFSKMDAGQLALETVPFDLDHLLDGCCDLARQQLDGKPVAISLVREPGTLGWFAADPTRLRQVVLNLLTNAVKFTDHGRITLSAVHREETGTLRVDITDTGIGIPPERIGSLFERFTQADTPPLRGDGPRPCHLQAPDGPDAGADRGRACPGGRVRLLVRGPAAAPSRRPRAGPGGGGRSAPDGRAPAAAGRGQRRQRRDHRGDARDARLRGLDRPRRGGRGAGRLRGHGAGRPDPHGPPDAGHGRPQGHGRDPGPRDAHGAAAPAHRGPHGQRAGRGCRGLPRGRHGRPRGQARRLARPVRPPRAAAGARCRRGRRGPARRARHGQARGAVRADRARPPGRHDGAFSRRPAPPARGRPRRRSGRAVPCGPWAGVDGRPARLRRAQPGVRGGGPAAPRGPRVPPDRGASRGGRPRRDRRRPIRLRRGGLTGPHPEVASRLIFAR